MTAERLILWRHGQTDWNATARFQGQADVPLNAVGRTQAAAAASVLAGLGPSALWSSDLQRAQQTASFLGSVTGLPVQLDKRLREIHVGSWEGLTGDEVGELEPDTYALLQKGEDVRRSPTGETVVEVGERVAEALAEIASGAADGTTVVVALHGLGGRAGMCSLLGLPFASWRVFGSLGNAAWAVLHRHRAGAYWRVAEYDVRAPRASRTIS